MLWAGPRAWAGPTHHHCAPGWGARRLAQRRGRVDGSGVEAGPDLGESLRQLPGLTYGEGVGGPVVRFAATTRQVNDPGGGMMTRLQPLRPHPLFTPAPRPSRQLAPLQPLANHHMTHDAPSTADQPTANHPRMRGAHLQSLSPPSSSSRLSCPLALASSAATITRSSRPVSGGSPARESSICRAACRTWRRAQAGRAGEGALDPYCGEGRSTNVMTPHARSPSPPIPFPIQPRRPTPPRPYSPSPTPTPTYALYQPEVAREAAKQYPVQLHTADPPGAPPTWLAVRSWPAGNSSSTCARLCLT